MEAPYGIFDLLLLASWTTFQQRLHYVSCLICVGRYCTMTFWFPLNWFGRRTLYIGGRVVQTVLLLTAGALRCVSNAGPCVHWAIGSMLLIYTFCYDATIGPVCYALVFERSSSRLWTKTIVLARNLYNILGLITLNLMTRMLNPPAWDWGAKSGFFWAAPVSSVWCGHISASLSPRVAPSSSWTNSLSGKSPRGSLQQL